MTTPDVKRAFDALKNKNLPYSQLWEYYEGNQPLRYSTARLQEAFRSLNARFNENWCAVVVDAVLDRLALKGWDAANEADNQALDAVFSRQRVGLDAYDAHLAALVCHEAFVIVDKDETDQVQVWFNDPRLCHMFYRADNPKAKEFAAKWWKDEAAGGYRMDLYYPERIEHYLAKGKNLPGTAGAFHPDPDNESEENPYGEIPVFHLRTSRRGTGELQNVLTLQDAVNKLVADMMVAAEYGAFMQRWIITNSDTEALKNGPNVIWTIPAGDGQGQQSSVGQFDATPLDNYLKAIDKLAAAIAVITRTPKHYLFEAGANISGEALLAMEAPLVKKTEQRQGGFGATWQEVGAFVLKLVTGRTVHPADIAVVWQPAPSTQPLTEALTRKTATEAGVPLVTQLRWEGKDAGEIKAMEKDRAAEQAEQAKTLAQAVLNQQRNFDRGNPGNNMGERPA
jgi:hypothetical protein